MKNLFMKRLVTCLVLASWCVQPTFAAGRIVVEAGNVVDSIGGISDSVYDGGYQGGAVDNQGTVGSVTGEFINNSIGTSSAAQQVRGGAINNAGSMTIDGALFQGNTAVSANPTYSYGGAIYNDAGGNLTIGSGTTFKNNTAAYGGGLYNWSNATLTLADNVTFDGNHATNGSGGAIHTRNGFSAGDNLLIQNNTTGAGSYGGGGIYIGIADGKNPPPTRKDVVIGDGAKFINNKTDINRSGSRGGAILAEEASGGVKIGKNSVFSGNEAQAGGAIWNQVELTIGDNAAFIGNKSHGAAFGASGGAIANLKKLIFSGASLFNANEAKAGNGGAIANAGNMVFKDTSIYTNNKASGMGGAIFNGGTLTFEKGAIFGELVINDDGVITGGKDGNTAGVHGGAIANQGGTVIIGDNSLFAGNSAGVQGGAISNIALNKADSSAKVTIGDGAYFVSNTSGAEGGAISNVNAFGVGTVEMVIGDKAVFLNNKSGTQGGAIHNQRASLKIGNDALFEGNTAVGYGGGAIYSDSSVGTSSSVIIGNAAAFINNKTETSHGGAIMNFNAGNDATFAIGTDAFFQGNNAKKNGGAIANYGGVMTIAEGSTFIGNNSGGNGGAIYQNAYGVSTSSITINGGHTNSGGQVVDTIFSENVAAGKGGAIYAAGTVNLNAVNGNILFDKNKAGGVANDIYVADGGVINIIGNKTVTSNSGIAGDAPGAGVTGGIINNEANLVLNGDNSSYLGSYNQTAGTTTLNNNKFFGGQSNIKHGALNITGKSEIVKDSIVDIDANGSMNIASGSNTLMNGIITGTGSIINEGNFTIGGDGSGFTGDYTQKSGTTTIKADGIFFGGNNTIEKGVLALEIGASLGEDITVTDYSVAFNLHGREVVIGNNGIEIEGKDGNTHYINGSLNLEDAAIKVDSSTGLTSDMYLGSGASLKNDDGSSTIEIGKGGEDITVSLGGGFSNSGQTLNVGDGSTISLTPKAVAETDTDKTVLVIDAVINGGADANIIVDGTELKSGEGKYDVGTVIINSVNDSFTGNYTQSDGTVVVNKDAVFFNGSNTVEGGTLVLIDGAKLSNSVTIDGSGHTGGAIDSPALAVTGSLGEITQDMITNGNFNHANTADSSADNVQIDQGGLVLANKSIIKNENLTDGTLTLNNGSGVRYLGFANGAGVDGNVSLGSDTALSYGDGAFVKSDSTLTMDNAELVFLNDNSKINYGVEIKGTGSINQNGSGVTNVSSGLSQAVVDVVAEGGTLNFVNKDSTKLDKVDITNDATVNVASNNATIGDVNVTGKDATMNIFGDAIIGDTVIKEATLGIFGNSQMGDLSLGSTLNMMGNKQINNLNTGAINLTGDSNITFDADVRNNLIDTINGSSFNGNGNKLIISGIDFVNSPIDRQFQIDTNKLVQVGGSSAGANIELENGSYLATTEMGRYLISSTGSTGILSGTLTELNPQMYRAQVATVASYANQLVVNNMLFDHMGILGRQLLAEEKANVYAAAYPQFAPYQYSKKDGGLWYKAYGNFETISMTQGLNVRNNAYGSLIGADFPLKDLGNGWNMVPTAYIAYNGAHQTFNGVGMYQNGAQLGAMGTVYKGDFITSLLAYGGGYANDMSVKGQFGSGSDTTGNWFAGVASKTAYNIKLPADFILQPTALVSYNIFGSQNFGSNFGAMSMNSGMLNGVNVAPGVNLIWAKKTFSLYATAQMVFNIMGDVGGKAGNIDLNDVGMRHGYFEYGIGAMKKFKDKFTGYLQITVRNGGRTGIGFQGGLQWKVGK